MWDGGGTRSSQGCARESPARAPWARQAGKGSPGRVKGRETQMENRQQGRKAIKDAGLDKGSLPRSREGTRMTWPGANAEGGDGARFESSGEQSRRQIGQQSLQPHRNAPLGSALRHRLLAPSTLVCGLPVKCANRNCCFSSELLPTRSSGQEWGSTHRTQRTPPAHTWVTPNTTVPQWKLNFKKPIYT